MKRRQFNQTAGRLAAYSVLLAATAGCAQEGSNRVSDTSAGRAGCFEQAVLDIERRSGGRLGVAVVDTGTGAAYAYRGDERFPLTSTFKFLAAALVLSRVDRGQESLSRLVAVRPSDLLAYAPVTEKRVGGAPMSVAELCEAAVESSDNTAGNLLLRSFGGPPELTAYVRGLGDGMTRLDRIEPDLNEATPGDPRDTTTPNAMLRNIRRLVLGDVLARASRDRLTRWLLANKVGDRKLRAQLPAGWRVADKTGGGGHGSNNDVGVLWPPGRAPIVVTAFLTDTQADPARRDAALAEVGRMASQLL